MKIKEVCEATGLTERAVRLYCANDLIEPIRTEVRGRTYLEFDETHITTLKQIADLRGAGFSLEEIKTVIDEPHLISQLLGVYRSRLAAEQGTQARFLAALDEAAANPPPADIAALCAMLYPPEKPREYTNGAALRAPELSYREFVERGTPVQTEIDYRGYRRVERRILWGRIAMIFLGICFWIEAVLLLIGMLREEALLFGVLLFGLAVVIWVFLMRGVVWLRVLMAIHYFIETISYSRMMTKAWPHLVTYHSVAEDGTTAEWAKMQGSWPEVGLYGVLMLCCALCLYLILFSRSVREYLYDRSTRN